MEMARQRSERIAEQLKRELPALLRMQVRDPRISGLVTITEVSVSEDYLHAKVFFTVLDSRDGSSDVCLGLNNAAGFLRSQLASVLRLRSVPMLHFVFDESIGNGIRISKLIDEALSRHG